MRMLVSTRRVAQAESVTDKLRLFISYSRKDKEMADESVSRRVEYA